jgi:hypothetical protein
MSSPVFGRIGVAAMTRVAVLVFCSPVWRPARSG